MGRSTPLHALDDALTETAAGSARVVLVVGEAGVGKTRLLLEFFRRSDPAATCTLLGGCVDLADRGPPFAPFAQALRPLARDLPQDMRDGLFGHGGRGRAEVFETVLRTLTQLAEPSPVVLAVEDVHWADRSTRDLLSFLVRNLDRQRVLLLLTFRSDGPPAGHPVRGWLSELERNRTVQRIDLQGLTSSELAEQVTAILGSRPDPGLTRALYARSEGNPFYTEELLAAGDSTAAGLSPTLREILLSRVRDAAPPTARVLRVAAVGGRRVTALLLAAVAGLPDAQLVDALRHAVDAHLLRVDGGSQYAFRHELLREAVYGDLHPAERTTLHLAYAAALEADPTLGGGADAAAADLANHWSAGGDVPRALSATVRAGEVAWRSSGYAEAWAQWRQALVLWHEVPDAAVRVATDRVRLERRTAQAAHLAGEHGEAARHARAALALVEADANPEEAAALHERLGRYLWAAGDSQSATVAYDRALDLSPAESRSPVRARVLAARGQALMLRAHYREARTLSEQAIGLARAVHSRAVEGHALNTHGFARACLGEVDEGLGDLRAARVIAEEVDDLDDLLRARVNLSEALLHAANRYEEAAEVALAGVAEASARGLEADYGVSLRANAAMAWHTCGRWHDALRLLAEAAGTGPTEISAIDLHQALARVLVGRGDFARAREHVAEARALMAGTLDPQYVVPLCAREAELALWQRRPEVARRCVAAGLEAVEGTDDLVLTGQLLWLGARAEAEQALDVRPHYSEAATLRRRARATRLARRADVAGSRATLPPLTAAHLALCHAEVSRLGDDCPTAPWEHAVDRLDRAGSPYLGAYARWRHAEAMLAHRRGRDAEQELRSAYDVAASLDAAPLLDEVAALARRGRVDLAQPAAPPPAEPSPAAALGLTPRECDVLGLLATGMTNREVAGTLFVTEKTAAAHVSNVLAKLDVRSRTEAAAVAHRLGIGAADAPSW